MRPVFKHLRRYSPVLLFQPTRVSLAPPLLELDYIFGHFRLKVHYILHDTPSKLITLCSFTVAVVTLLICVQLAHRSQLHRT
jgi:hypothetical protein